LEGSVIGQLQEAVTFIRNNSHKRWWKENDHREELPDYPERAVTETIANAIIHRDYMQMGSEIHVDMYNDRLEIYSPGGMMDGKLIQQLNPLTVPSKRRNPLLADFFSRLGLMERRGSGMRKIIDAYKQYEHLTTYHKPEFTSNASEFHVTLWNLNYVEEEQKEFLKGQNEFLKDENEFLKEKKEFLKDEKEFRKVKRMIYKMVSTNPQITVAKMSVTIGLSDRQVRKYIKKLTDLNLIIREGGRKNGSWKIVDEEYENFFKQL
jgi:predicted HTH transcriptional regulator